MQKCFRGPANSLSEPGGYNGVFLSYRWIIDQFPVHFLDRGRLACWSDSSLDLPKVQLGDHFESAYERVWQCRIPRIT